MKTLMNLFFAAGLFIAGIAYGHSDATGIVLERMNAMKDMGDKSKIVADMFKGKADLNREAISDAAVAFASHGHRIAELFPDSEESRTGSNTEALPAIWEEWDEFNSLVAEFISNSEALAISAASDDDASKLKKVFFQTAKNCTGCHKRFRKRKR